MWVKLDAAEGDMPSQVGAGLAVKYQAIATFSIDELETETPVATERAVEEAPIEDDDFRETPAFMTVGDVLAWARSEISRLSGMASDAIKLDLKIEA